VDVMVEPSASRLSASVSPWNSPMRTMPLRYGASSSYGLGSAGALVTVLAGAAARRDDKAASTARTSVRRPRVNATAQ
jgi:hypothetical protein